MIAGSQMGDWINPAIRFIFVQRPAMIVHLCAAVRAEHQAGQRICRLRLVSSVHCPSDLLRQLPGLPIHDSFVGTLKIAEWRGQSDRNIRKIRNTALQKIRRKALPALLQRDEEGESLTNWERGFLTRQGIVQTDHDGENFIEAASDDTDGGEGDEEIL